MVAFIVRRSFHAVVVLIGVTLVTFVLQHVIASGTTLARAMLGPRANPLSIRAFVHQYGLNKPLPVQYWSFLWQLLHGNLGYSYKLNQSVDSILARDLPNDLLLVGTALVLAVLIAVPLGIAQAGRRGKFFDQLRHGRVLFPVCDALVLARLAAYPVPRGGLVDLPGSGSAKRQHRRPAGPGPADRHDDPGQLCAVQPVHEVLGYRHARF